MVSVPLAFILNMFSVTASRISYLWIPPVGWHFRFARATFRIPVFIFLIVSGLLMTMVSHRVSAQPASTPGFSFLRIENSARTLALGGAVNTGSGADVSLFLDNPASINASMHSRLSLTYLNHLSDVRSGSIAYGRTVSSVGTFAGAIRYFGYGNLDHTDSEGNILGAFSANDAALSLGYGREITDRVRLGAAIHGIFSRIDEASASAVAVDAGVLYSNPVSSLTLAASLHNLGFVLNSLGETDDELPVDLRAGLSKKLTYLPFTLNITAFNLLDFSEESLSTRDEVLAHIALGGEFQLGSALRFRVGYNHLRNQMLRSSGRLDLAGLGLGFNLALSRFQFDYGYNTWSSLGRLHQFTVHTSL